MFRKIWKALTRKVDDNAIQSRRHEREMKDVELKSRMELINLHSELAQEKRRLESKASDIINKSARAIAREQNVLSTNGYFKHFVLDKEGLHNHDNS